MHAHDEINRRLFAVFLAGWVVGFIVATVLAGQDADLGGTYNPVRYYRQLVQLQASPWALLSPELSASLRDSRREILGGTAAALLTLGAYAYGGAPLALKAASGAQSLLHQYHTHEDVHVAHHSSARRGRWPRAIAAAAAAGEGHGKYPMQMIAPPTPVEVD